MTDLPPNTRAKYISRMNNDTVYAMPLTPLPSSGVVVALEAHESTVRDTTNIGASSLSASSSAQVQCRNCGTMNRGKFIFLLILLLINDYIQLQ